MEPTQRPDAGEGDELSGEEPGYVPPDHKSTTEFKIPKLTGAADDTVQDEGPAAPENAVGDTFVDRPADPEPMGMTVQDLPVDDLPEDDPEDDLPVDDLPEDAFEVPSTMTDFPADTLTDSADPGPEDATPPSPGMVPLPPYALGQDDPPDEPGPALAEPTLTDAPAPPEPGDRDLDMAQPTRAESPSVTWTPAAGSSVPPIPAPDVQRSEPSETPPPAPVVPPGPWTEQFGTEEATGQQSAAFAQEAPTNPTTDSRRVAGPPPAPPFAAPIAPPPPSGPSGPSAPPLLGSATSPTPPPPPGPQLPPVPAMSPSGGMPPTGPVSGTGGKRRPLLLAAVILVLLALGGGGIAVAILASGGGDPGSKAGTQSSPPAAPSSSAPAPNQPGASGQPPSGSPAPSGGTGGGPGGQVPGGGIPAPTGPPIGPVVNGKGITYQLVQQDPGYFEGKLVITNKTSKPMKDWKITFTAPKANVKNIWGARLVRKGDQVEIRNLENAPAIAPGATWEIQYGAVGAPVEPQKCRLNDKSCGF
jgi:hypothetical protein